MAENRTLPIQLSLLVAILAVAVLLTPQGVGPVWQWVLGAAILAAAQLIVVPVPSEERLSFGLAVVVAGCLLVWNLPSAVVAVVASSIVSAAIVRTLPKLTHGRHPWSASFAVTAAELIPAVSYCLTFFGVRNSFFLQGLTGDVPDLVAVVAGGLAWFVTRAATKAVSGFERTELSMRYLWLLALEDWAAILSLITTGALFGFSWTAMRAWSIPVALLPYGFSHLAFVRYAGTRRTYGQTIRALAQIPEVAGLSPVGHARRTAALAVAVARELGFHPHDMVDLEYAALMHDIGRITLNEPAILRAGYTDADVARWGAQIISEAPHLFGVADVVREHHRPYRQPGQLGDPSLPMSSKTIKVASAYDRITKELELPPLEALEELHRGSTYEYDPSIIRSLRRVLASRGVISA